MAENEDGQEKTETPSARRRDEARKKGNVAKSSEVNSAVILLVGSSFLLLAGGNILADILKFMQEYFTRVSAFELTPDGSPAFLVEVLFKILSVIAPFLAVIAAAGIISNLLQVGFLFSAEAMQPKLEKLNPLSGLKRLFALRSLVELLKNLLKLTTIGLVVYMSLRSNLLDFFRVMQESTFNILAFLGTMSGNAMLQAAIAMLVLGLADYFYQRYEHEKNLKMTKQEVKDENKLTEGNPQIKARIREVQRAAARNRMLADVPKADVVITNPIHYAVALKYEPARSTAPIMVAKGERLLAQKIKSIAQEHGIPIVEDPPLARMLFRQGEVGTEIPFDAYQAVAEVLGYVYRMQNRRMSGN